MEKIDKILKVISDKSDALYIVFEDYIKNKANANDMTEIVGQIAILNEVYEEVQLIQAEDV